MYNRFTWITLLFVVVLTSVLTNDNCYFQCKRIQSDGSRKCLQQSDVCNGKADCLDGSDELFGLCKSVFNTTNFFECANGAKIDMSLKCNGRFDCIDKSDESPRLCYQSEPNNNALDLHGKDFSCENKIWESEYTDTSCTNMCSTKHLFCRDTLRPHCTFLGKIIPCKSQKGLLPPDTKAKFSCPNGYSQSKRKLVLKCGKNGIWKNTFLTDMDSYCTMDCGKIADPTQRRLQRSRRFRKHKKGPRIGHNKASWSVAIFSLMAYRSDFEYICGGVLIRHNLVLTAADCVTTVNTTDAVQTNLIRVGPVTSTSSIVSKDYGWDVMAIMINTNNLQVGSDSATALVQIMENKHLLWSTICVPGVHECEYRTPPIEGFTGRVYAWNTDQIMPNHTLTLGLIQAKVETHSVNQDTIDINVMLNRNLCKSNIGSGFIGDCSKRGKLCLHGILTATGRGTNDHCADKAHLVSAENKIMINFINQVIRRISNTCDQIYFN